MVMEFREAEEGTRAVWGGPGRTMSSATTVRGGPRTPAAGCLTGPLSASIFGNWKPILLNIMDTDNQMYMVKATQ